LKISKNVPPKMAGIERRKENLTASLADHPRALAVAMVDPLREMPGIKAMACIVPIKKKSVLEMGSFIFLAEIYYQQIECPL
jgi:hypothetical protein